MRQCLQYFAIGPVVEEEGASHLFLRVSMLPDDLDVGARPLTYSANAAGGWGSSNESSSMMAVWFDVPFTPDVLGCSRCSSTIMQ